MRFTEMISPQEQILFDDFYGMSGLAGCTQLNHITDVPARKIKKRTKYFM